MIFYDHKEEFRKIDGRIEVKGRRDRRRDQLVDDLKEKIGYWKLAALDGAALRTCFARGY
jgi:hypothetical protein